MDEKDFETYIDFGASKIRIGIFDKNFSKLIFCSEKKCISTFNLKYLDLNESKKILHELILSAEKKIGNYIKNVNLMFDPTDLESFDLSIKKNLENKKISIEEIKLLLQESRQQILKNYFDKKIMHTIIKKYIIDEEEFYTIPENGVECSFLILEVKFICYPKKIFEYIDNHFKENHINIKNFFCSSYAKALDYNKNFENYENKVFLDIGYKKSCLSIFDKKGLIHFYSISLGGNHITKDISNVLKISEKESEDLKQSFNKSETVFSDVLKEESSSNFKKNEVKNIISTDILKNIIYARIDEIINLIFKNINFSKIIFDKRNSILILTGEGFKILNKNSIYLGDRFNLFNEMSFFEENSESICRAGYNFLKNANLNEVSFLTKEPKKTGFFEKLFHLFR